MVLSFDETLEAIKGNNHAHRPPYSLWKHFPGKDINLNDIITSHDHFQKISESDLIKFSPHSKFCLIDFGLEIDYSFHPDTGSYFTKKYPINSVLDWEKIDEIDVLDGEFGKQLKALKKFSRIEKFENIPIMMTIFLPMMVADKLVSNNNLINHIIEEPTLLKDRLNVIGDVIKNFAESCIDDGANGLFLATQHAEETKTWDENQWKKFVYPTDNLTVKSANKKSEFTVLHLHGANIFFSSIMKLMKTTAINWHPSDKLPAFLNQNNIGKYSGGLLGGIDENKIINVSETEDEVKKYVDELIGVHKPFISQFLIAPGCVLSQKLSESKLLLLVKKLKEIKLE